MSWQTSSVIYIYQFIFNLVNSFSFWLPENLPVTRKSFNKTLPRIYHLDDRFGCSSGNRRYTATCGSPQTLGRVFLAPGREQILLMGPVSPVKHWNLTFTHWLLSVWEQVMLYLFNLFLSTWILCVPEDSELGCRVQEFLTLGSTTETPPEVSDLTSTSCGWIPLAPTTLSSARCEAKQRWRFNSQDPHPRRGEGCETFLCV